MTSTALTFAADEPVQSQPHEGLHRRLLPAGQHFDASVGKISRIAAHAELARPLRGGAAIKHPLDAARNQAFLADHGPNIPISATADPKYPLALRAGATETATARRLGRMEGDIALWQRIRKLDPGWCGRMPCPARGRGQGKLR